MTLTFKTITNVSKHTNMWYGDSNSNDNIILSWKHKKLKQNTRLDKQQNKNDRNRETNIRNYSKYAILTPNLNYYPIFWKI